MSFYEKAKIFAEQYITPFSAECDEKGIFPQQSFEQMGKHGYFSLLIPTELGGLGKKSVEHAEVCCAFAEANPTAGLCYMMHNVALKFVLTYGSEELKKKVCQEIVNEEKFLGLAYSEFGTGTHFYLSELKATINNDKVILNGSKSMVTSATYASWYLIVTLGQEEGIQDNWLVPLDTPGLNFDMASWHGIGMRGNVSAPMHMNEAQLDLSWRCTSTSEEVLDHSDKLFMIGLAAVYSGICLSQSRFANEHAMMRKYPNAKSLSSIETVQGHLGSIYTKAIAAQQLALEAARADDRGDKDVDKKIFSARILSSESAIECGRLAMRIGGGKAYNKQLPIERFLRDAYASQVMAPSTDVLSIWLGKTLTEQSIP